MPSMAESITEGTLKQWLKEKGDYVEADEEVATIETDKVRPQKLSQWLLPRPYAPEESPPDLSPSPPPRRLTSPSTPRKPAS